MADLKESTKELDQKKLEEAVKAVYKMFRGECGLGNETCAATLSHAMVEGISNFNTQRALWAIAEELRDIKQMYAVKNGLVKQDLKKDNSSN